MNEAKHTWRVLCYKQAWLAGTSNYLPDILWDVINCPCRCKLLLVQHSWDVICIVNTTSLCFIEYNVGHTSERIKHSVKHNGYVILVNVFCGLCKHTHTHIYTHTPTFSIYMQVCTRQTIGRSWVATMGLLPDMANCVCACAGNAGNVFPSTGGKRSRHASRHVRDARAVTHAGIAN